MVEKIDEVGNFTRDNRRNLERIATNIGVPEQEAEDVVQDALVKALDRGIEDITNIAAFIRKVTTTTAIDRVRRDEKHKSDVYLSEFGGTNTGQIPRVPEPHDPANLESHVQTRDDLRAVLQELEGLTPQRKRAVALSAQGLSLNEIAAIEHARPNTIYARVWHGRDKLRKAIEG